MKRKHLYIILALLAVAVLLYAPSLIRGPEFGGAADGGDGIVLARMEGSEVTAVDVTDPDEGDTIHLERADGGWTVNGHRADSTKVADLLAVLDTVRASRLQSDNPDNHPRMGVDEETGRRVRIATAGGEEAAFFLGDRDLSSDDYFVRHTDQPRVYLLGGPLGGYLGRAADDWRDRFIADADTAAAREIVIARNETQIPLVRGQEGWTVDDAPADSAAVAELLRSLVDLRATGFPSDSAAAAADFDAPDATVSVFVAGGDDVTGRELAVSLRLVEPEEGGPWLVKRADDPEVYEVFASLARRLAPTREDLVGEG